ncbi:MAG: TIGR03905 family TSCPD domain-containing protein [Prevotella sp.]|nr:TIGR03905 family TSCPD domain-containing protein [Prevotella sp.]
MATKHIQYETRGTCSKLIDVTCDENDVIQQVFFLGGCNGNLQGISQLVLGQKIDDVMKRLDGIRCGTKATSCPDQLCRALEQLRKAPLQASE